MAYQLWWLVLIAVLLVSDTSRGEQKPIDSTTNDHICTAMRGDDPVKTQQAVKEIEILFKTQPKAAVHELSSNWAIWMWKTQKFKELATVCRLALLAAPEQTADVEHLVLIRGECLLYAGGGGCESSAKSLYNVATVEGVGKHFDFIVKALKAPKKADQKRADRFLAEQQGQGTDTPVLAEIKVIPLYKAKIAKMTDEDFSTLIGRGNLLLVDDRADEAKQSFEKALSVAGDGDQKSAATEGIARAIKAKDGTLSKAREYLTEHQKKDAATASSTK